MKRLLIFTVLSLLASSFLFSHRASAAPQDYAFTVTGGTNHYWGSAITYSFTGLDAAQQYTFQAIFTDENGNLGDVIATKIIGAGSTTGTFGYNLFAFDDTFTPYIVIDNFDQILTRHYAAPDYLASWQTNDGVTDAVNKQGIKSVPYIELNADGYHHDYDNPELVTVNPLANNNYTLLHYNLSTTDRLIRIFDMYDHTEVLEFNLEEIQDYNNGATAGFIALNISGEVLPFVDQTLSAASFVGAYDNPLTSELASGAYEYGRYNAANTMISFGESVLLVSEANNGDEWTITPRTNIVESENQVVTLQQKTGHIWDAYQNQELEDSAIGSVDDTDYPFDTSRKYAYTVGVVADSPATVTWHWEPYSLFEPSLLPEIFRFEIPEAYEIIAAVSTEADAFFSFTLASIGMDSDFGQIIMMISLMLAGMFITRNGFVALAVFFAVGGLFIMLGFATPLTALLFAGGALLAVILFLRRSTNTVTDGG